MFDCMQGKRGMIDVKTDWVLQNPMDVGIEFCRP